MPQTASNSALGSGPDGARPGYAWSLVIAAGAMCAILAAGAIWVWMTWDHPPSIQDFIDTIRSWGVYGIAASIALMVLHSFIPFPAELLACANGMIYGPYLGTLITWVGAMLGASLAFGLARRLGRPFAERMIEKRNWGEIDAWTERHGWQPLLISRFIPIIAFNLINYAAGLSRVTWWEFLWTTGIGILPLTALMVTLGDNIDSFGWQSWALLLGFGLLMWWALRRAMGSHAPHG